MYAAISDKISEVSHSVPVLHGQNFLWEALHCWWWAVEGNQNGSNSGSISRMECELWTRFLLKFSREWEILKGEKSGQRNNEKAFLSVILLLFFFFNSFLLPLLNLNAVFYSNCENTELLWCSITSWIVIKTGLSRVEIQIIVRETDCLNNFVC